MDNTDISFSLDYILHIIDAVALDAMMTPTTDVMRNSEKFTLAEVANYNSLIAMNNDGVRDLAMRLKDEFTRESEGKA